MPRRAVAVPHLDLGHDADGFAAVEGFVDLGVAKFVQHADEEFAVDFVVFGDEEGKGVFL